MGLPLLLLPTPAATVFVTMIGNKGTFLNFHNVEVIDYFIPHCLIIASLLWIGGLLAMGFYFCNKTNIILARDKDMFLTPHYNSVFLEQFTILNRQVRAVVIIIQ
jgi:hypothetical protein